MTALIRNTPLRYVAMLMVGLGMGACAMQADLNARSKQHESLMTSIADNRNS